MRKKTSPCDYSFFIALCQRIDKQRHSTTHESLNNAYDFRSIDTAPTEKPTMA